MAFARAARGQAIRSLYRSVCVQSCARPDRQPEAAFPGRVADVADTLPTPSRWRRFRHRQAWLAVPFLLLAIAGAHVTPNSGTDVQLDCSSRKAMVAVAKTRSATPPPSE